LDRKDSFISRYVYRPISFYLAVPFVRLGFSANQVTLLGLLIASIGLILLATGNPPVVLAGSILCAIQVLLDYVDGNIARLHGKTSHLGKFLDGIVDTIISVLTPLAVAVGLYSRPDWVMLAVGAQVNLGLILLAGALTSIAVCLQILFIVRLQAARFELQLQSERSSAQLPITARGPRSGLLRLAVSNLEYGLKTESYFMLTGIVLFAALGMLSVYIVIHWIARSLAFLLEAVRTVAQARQILDVHRIY
jgi:phosphatidylserine synthase